MLSIMAKFWEIIQSSGGPGGLKHLKHLAEFQRSTFDSSDMCDVDRKICVYIYIYMYICVYMTCISVQIYIYIYMIHTYISPRDLRFDQFHG